MYILKQMFQYNIAEKKNIYNTNEFIKDSTMIRIDVVNEVREEER